MLVSGALSAVDSIPKDEMRRLTPRYAVPCMGLQAVTTGSLPIRVVMVRHYLLIITALRAGEGPYLAGAEGGDDGGLVPLEDVGALFAPLAEGHDRAPLVDDQTSLNLYSHVRAVPQKVFRWIIAIRKRLYPNLRLLPTAKEHLPTRNINWRTQPLAPINRGSINSVAGKHL